MKGVFKRPPVVVLPDEALVRGAPTPRVKQNDGKKKKPKPATLRKPR